MLAIGQVAIKRYFSTFRIKTYRTHLLIFGLAYLAASVWGTVFVYYVVNVLNESQTNVAYLQMFSIVSIPVTIIAGRAITKITPRTLYFIAFGLVLVSCVEVGLLGVSQPKDTMSWLIWVSFIYNVGQYILWFIPWSIFPYIPDLDTLITGQNRSGVFAAVMMFFYQTFYAIGSVAVGMLLDVSGFVKSSAGTIPQPESAKNMIIIMISLGVGSLIIGAWWSASKLKLNQTTIGIVTREVKRLKAGGDMADVKANTKQVCEMLTGIRYDSIKVWKNSRRRK
jgi:oligogalacturonide transporter